jgi:hypothetical protein
MAIMTKEETQTRLDAIGKEIDALTRFNLNGYDFRWEEGWKGEIRLYGFDGFLSGYYLTPEGGLESYSFHSESGSAKDAAESRRYFTTCAELLSDRFREKFWADYQNKKEPLHNLIEEMRVLWKELD